MRRILLTQLICLCFVGLSEKVFGQITMQVSARRAFVRMENNAYLTVTVTNKSANSISDAMLHVSAPLNEENDIPLPELKASAGKDVKIQLNTRLAPGEYRYGFSVSLAKSQEPVSKEDVSVYVVARKPPLRMPVVMWQMQTVDADLAQELGFTHVFRYLIAERYAATARELDRALRNDYGIVGNLCPGAYINNLLFRGTENNNNVFMKMNRVGRNGKTYPNDHNVCCNFPEVLQFGFDQGLKTANLFGEFPAFSAALVETECRDHSRLCFHPHDMELLQKDTGLKGVPNAVINKYGVNLSKLEKIKRGVVSKDLPALTFLKWFWQKGDGWTTLCTQTHRGVKSNGNDDIWTFFDPAVRTPSISGSGGQVDFLNQWTYTYPDPIKIGKATDELFAMAELSENPDQKVMNMTQAIWYRSAVAPIRKEGSECNLLAKWEKENPKAPFVTTSPDHLREAFWCKISRPVRGIMYHGWEALVKENQNCPYGYRCTNLESQNVLKELTGTVVKPLGPMLLQIPDRPSDIAFLQSFTSEMLAGTGEYGWTAGWENDAYEILTYAQLQPRIFYEETIEKNGLDGYKVLVLVKCPYLPGNIVEIIKKFQREGGIVIGDETLAAAIMPDILLPTVHRTGKPDQDKIMLQKKARELRSELDLAYRRYTDSNNPDVIVRARSYKSTDYLFVVNDKRTFGDYVGQFGKVMENGLSTQAEIFITRPKGYVYDLVRHQRIESNGSEEKLSLPVSLGPGDGRLYMISDRSIDTIVLETPEIVMRGQSANVNISICDRDGLGIQAVVPLEVEILDPKGIPSEFSGFYGAMDGCLKLTLDLAVNDQIGDWTVKVTELASGLTTQKIINVTK